MCGDSDRMYRISKHTPHASSGDVFCDRRGLVALAAKNRCSWRSAFAAIVFAKFASTGSWHQGLSGKRGPTVYPHVLLLSLNIMFQKDINYVAKA